MRKLNKTTARRVNAIRTGPEYVRYSAGHDKWYRAVIEETFGTVRVSRRIFDRANDAVSYRQAVLSRVKRLREISQFLSAVSDAI